MNNQRNKNNVKDSSSTYLEGGWWRQWTDMAQSLAEAKTIIKKDKTVYPEYEFIIKKHKEGFYRIYYHE